MVNERGDFPNRIGKLSMGDENFAACPKSEIIDFHEGHSRFTPHPFSSRALCFTLHGTKSATSHAPDRA
jgi:hypothetical protein